MNNTMFKIGRIEKALAVAVLILFVLYWLLTLLYVSPNNPVRVHFLGAMSHFERYLYQKWGFFAPPPQHNQRIYYTFVPISPDAKEITLEVMEGVLKAKQKKAPFNQGELILDYIINGAVDQLSRVVSDRDVHVAAFASAGINQKGEIADEIVLDPNYALPAIRTLKNYALIVCKKNDIDPLNYRAKITVTVKNINRFQDRHMPAFHPEKQFFTTLPFDIPKAF